jgi:Ca2+-binding EF-hand superfamily protein
MPLPALILAMLAAGTGAPPETKPVVVTGHQWAPFISPMGEPFRAHSANDDTLANWFYRADRNRDGVLTVDELQADAERFFATLDTNHDGEIDPDELATYEYEIAPDIQVMAKTQRLPGQPAPAARKDDADEDHSRDRRHHRKQEDASLLGFGDALQGGARYGLLNMPEPVVAADTDFNRAISLEEFRQAAVARFQLLDSAHQGKLTLAQLEALRPALPQKRQKLNENAPDKRIGNPLPMGP